MRLALVLLPLCYGFIPTQPRRPSQLSVTRQQAEEWVQDVVDEVISQSSTHREDDPYHAAAAAADDDAGARIAAMDADARIAALEASLSEMQASALFATSTAPQQTAFMTPAAAGVAALVAIIGFAAGVAVGPRRRHHGYAPVPGQSEL